MTKQSKAKRNAYLENENHANKRTTWQHNKDTQKKTCLERIPDFVFSIQNVYIISWWFTFYSIHFNFGNCDLMTKKISRQQCNVVLPLLPLLLFLFIPLNLNWNEFNLKWYCFNCNLFISIWYLVHDSIPSIESDSLSILKIDLCLAPKLS